MEVYEGQMRETLLDLKKAAFTRQGYFLEDLHRLGEPDWLGVASRLFLFTGKKAYKDYPAWVVVHRLKP